MRAKAPFLFSFFLALLLASSCLGEKDNPPPLGSRSNPVKVYFTPSVDSGAIVQGSSHLMKFLEAETGLFFKTGVPSSYIAVVEAFGSKRVDIGVLLSPLSYLMANEKYGAQARLRIILHGEDHYRGQIVAREGRGIETIKDLQGKKFAFTDPSSTSGYMFPQKLLKDHSVTPSETVFAMKHDSVVTMVYQGQVDAGATFYLPPGKDGQIRDARSRVQTQFPDVEKKVKIIQMTEKIPNGAFTFRKDLSPSIVTLFIKAIKKYFKTKEGKDISQKILSIGGVVDIKDEDYSGLRAMVKAIDLDLAQHVK